MERFILSPIILSAMLLLFLNINSGFAGQNANKSSEKMVFFGVGEYDDINSALKKNLDRNASCVKGKSTSLEIEHFNIENAELSKRITEIVEIDNNLRDWGSTTKPESMPIDVLHCLSSTAKAFYYWDYFFSNLDGKLLSITIYVKNLDAVREQLIIKHGQCFKNGYCFNNGSILFLTENNDKTFIIVLFEKNIKSHYEIIKKKELKKRNLEKKSIKEAF